MNIKRIIREEMEGFKDSTEEDWDWGIDVEPEDHYNVDYSEDYMSVWPKERGDNMASTFIESCIDINSGVVSSDDYSGVVSIELDTVQHSKIRIHLEMEYDEDKGDSLITWKMYYNNNGWELFNNDIIDGGEYYPTLGWLSPIKDSVKKNLSVCK